MDAIGIDFAALLPAFMRAQEDDAAMAAALSPVLRARALQLASLGISDFLCDADAPLTDAQASTLLDSLAAYMGLEWWRADWDTATKRGMMAQAEKLRQLSESKWALETILRVYFGDPALTVEEWWEYGGAPYCFRVLTANAEAQAALRFKNVVELIKRQSQQWEGLWAGFSCRGVIYRGALGTDDTRLTGEVVLYRYLPRGTTVDGADGFAALSDILTEANPGQDVTDILDDCFDYGTYTVTADLPLTFQEYGLPDWQAIPSTRAAGARLDAAMAAHWGDVGADVGAPSLAYQWPPAGPAAEYPSSLLSGLLAFFPCEDDTEAVHGEHWTQGAAFSTAAGKVGDGLVETAYSTTTGLTHVADATYPALEGSEKAQRTCACWIKFTAYNGNSILAIRWSGGNAYGLAIRPSGFGEYFKDGNFDSMGRYHELTTPMQVGEWHHVAYTEQAYAVGGTTMTVEYKFYFDGALVETATPGSASVSLESGAHLIATHLGWASNCSAVLDEIGIWQRALSGDEIRALYQAGVDGASYPFEGYSPIDGGTVALKSGLQRFLPFDGTLADEKADETFTAISGTPAYVSGILDQAIQTPKAKGTFCVPAPSAAGAASAFAWLKLSSSYGQWGGALFGPAGSKSDGCIEAAHPSTNRAGITVGYYTEDGNWALEGVRYRAALSLRINAWHLVGYTWDGATLKLWLDGFKVGECASSGWQAVVDSAHWPFVGQTATQHGTACPGTVDDTAYWARALNESEIQALWNGGSGLPFEDWT